MDLDDLDKLWEATHSGAPGAREALGRALSRELCRFFANCFDTATAEDLAQTTMVVVWRKFDEFEPQGRRSFRNWVFTIAEHEARRISPRRVLPRRAKLRAHMAPAPRSMVIVTRDQHREFIAEVLSQLPEAHRRAVMRLADDHRTVMRLADEHHRTSAARKRIVGRKRIMARKRITVSSAFARLRRAIRSLWRRIAARGVTPATPA